MPNLWNYLCKTNIVTYNKNHVPFPNVSIEMWQSAQRGKGVHVQSSQSSTMAHL